MENQIVLIIGLAFVAALGFILKQANTAPVKQIKEKAVRQPKKPEKTKRPSQKKSQKNGTQVTEWVGVDTAAKDAQDMLEFLKGRDPKEISRAQKAQNPTPKPKPQAPVAAPVVQNKKGKNQKQQQEVQSDSEVSEDGFSTIQKKAVKPKEKKKNNKEAKGEEKDERSPRPKSFFKSEEDAKKEEAKKAKEGKAKGEKRERPPREKKERKERKEGEEGEASTSESEQPSRPKRERRERPEGEQAERPPRTIVAPNVPKYEVPDINDMLNSITRDYKPSPKEQKPPKNQKQSREATLFSKIPRNIVTDRILPYLNARDLLNLSQVNQYFRNAVKKESLWRTLYIKEFGTEGLGEVKSFLREYRKRKTGKGQQKGNTPKQ